MVRCIEFGCKGEIFFYITQEVKIRPDITGSLPEIEISFDETGMPVELKGTAEEITITDAKAMCDICGTRYKLQEKKI